MAYHHEYHQSLVYKILAAQKDAGVSLDFEQSLEAIRKVERLTRSIPQIVYLAGWQYEGHDSKYPDFFEVGHRLKGAADATARDSMLRLAGEARQHGATVSVHINMCDAYENAPSWDFYRKNDLLIRNADGSLAKGGVWGGEQSYLVCKAREWAAGQIQVRIDRLLELLPFIVDNGTIHIDVFQPRQSPFHGVTEQDDLAAMKQILLHWQKRGVDVTTEWFHFEFEGLTPMVWHLNIEEDARLKLPPEVICGGGSEWNFRRRYWSMDAYGAHWIRFPQAGCLYERAWGESMTVDVRSPQFEADFIQQFCLKTLPWYFLNRHRARRLVHTADCYRVEFDGDVHTEVSGGGRRFCLSEGGRTYVQGNDLCMPALWRPMELIAFSQEGADRTWPLPANWKGISRVAVHPLWPEEGTVVEKSVADEHVSLRLLPGQAMYIVPA